MIKTNKDKLPINGEDLSISLDILQEEGYLANKKQEFNGCVVINNKQDIYYYKYSDNLEECQNIALLKLTYDAQDGILANGNKKETIYTKYGNNADLTKKADKRLYNHLGWNTKKTASEGLKTFKMEKNSILYAIYKPKDTTPPELSISTSSTTNSITVVAKATDKESAIDKYRFRIDGGKWQTVSAVGTSATYVFTGLKHNQTYDIDNTTLGINNSNDITKQNRWALFVSAKFQFGNWGFGTGIRYEDINFDYYKNKEWNKEQSKKYHKLFPNLFTKYSKGDIQAILSYERKIKYPTYSALRSNIQYSSPYVYESGNPMLLPQIQNDFTCIFGYKDIKAILGYTLYEDYMTQIMELYNGNSVVLVKPDNLKDVKNRFFALSYTPTLGIWRPSIELGGQWQDLSLSGKTYDKPIFNIRLNNSLTFPHQWFVTVNVGWQSKGNSGIYLLKPSLQTNVNISKSLFNNKMSISLMINDIFKTDKVQWGIDHSNIVFDYDKYTDSRYVQLTIRYNFNAAKSKYKGDSSSDERQRL